MHSTLAFEWENPQTGLHCHKDLKNSPTSFGNRLAKELEEQKSFNPQGAVLQYVGGVLLGTETKEQNRDLTAEL